MTNTIPANPGRVPDPPDDRDHLYRTAIQPVALARPAIYRTNLISPILDQGQTPKCVTYSTTAARNRHERIETGQYVFGASSTSYAPGRNPSANWLYDECKKIDGWNGDGTNARAALTVMNRQGLISEDGKSFYKIGQYARLATVEEIMEAIWLHGTVLLGMDIDSNWERPGPGGRLGPPNGNIIGGHEVELVGYRDNTTFPIRDRGFWVPNTWGTWWGAKGYCRLPFDHLGVYDSWDAWWLSDAVD